MKNKHDDKERRLPKHVSTCHGALVTEEGAATIDAIVSKARNLSWRSFQTFDFNCPHCAYGVVIHWGDHSCAYCGTHYNDTIRMLQLEGKHENASLLNAYMEYVA